MHFIRTLLSACVVAGLLSGCAGAPESRTADTRTAEERPATATVAMNEDSGAESRDPDEMICKVETTVGSRIRRKVCATRAQWEMSEEYAQDATEKMQRGPKKLEEQ